MNLVKLYDSLIAVCEQRNGKPTSISSRVNGYEIHHIKARCMSGNNQACNLVYMTPREHYTAHHILARVHGGKLAFSFWRMSHGKKGVTGFNCRVTSRQYQTAKEIVAVSMVGNQNAKGYKNVLGYKHTPETREKMSNAHTGRTFTSEHREKISIALTGKSNAKGCKRTPERIAQIAETNRTRIISDETRALHAANFSKINKGKAKPKKNCPHCKQDIAAHVFNRWHGDNCKQRLADEKEKAA